MLDFIYVNILNEGPLPWIRKNGPLFGYKIGYGMYQIISKDPRIKIEIVNSVKEIEDARKKYLDEKKKAEEKEIEKQPIILHDSVEVSDIIEKESVELNDDSDIDAQMDLLLEVMGETPAEPTTFILTEKISTKEDIKKYTDEELDIMTRAEMKNILKERGYTTGPYAGKYHDTVETLKRKVLSTQ